MYLIGVFWLIFGFGNEKLGCVMSYDTFWLIGVVLDTHLFVVNYQKSWDVL